MSDRGFLAAWGLLEAAFGGQEKAKMNLFRQIFAGTNDERLKSAAMSWLSSHDLFPTVNQLKCALPGHITEKMDAEAAWSRVLRSAQHGPTDYNPSTGTMPTGADLDPLTLSACQGRAGLRRMWEAESEPTTMSFIKRDFLATYGELKGLQNAGMLPTGEPREAPSELLGDGNAPAQIEECHEGGV